MSVFGAILGAVGRGAATVGRLGGTTAVGVGVAQFTGAALDPWKRGVTYGMNMNDQSLLPDWSDMIKLYHTGHWTNARFWSASTRYGVRSHALGDRSWVHLAFRELVELQWPTAPLENQINWMKAGYLIDGFMDDRIRRLGLKHAADWEMVAHPNGPPDLGTLLEWRRRGYLDRNELVTNLDRMGLDVRTQSNWYDRLQYQMPGPSDLISFAVREVYDQDVVESFGYDDEYPPELQFWMDKQGFGGSPSDMGFGADPPNWVPWAKQFWRAHWNAISPSQAAEMMHRLRPTNFDGTESRVAGVKPFTRADFDRALKIADYPAKVREWFRGVAFSPMTRVDVRRAQRYGVMTGTEAVERYKDIGYDADAANVLAEIGTQANTNAITRFDRSRLETIARKLYSEGCLNRHDAAEQIFFARVESTREFVQYLNKTDTEKIDHIQFRTNIPAMLDGLDLQRTGNRCIEMKRELKKAFIKGKLTSAELTQSLGGILADQSLVTPIVNHWIRLRTLAERDPTVGQIQTGVAKGLLSADRANALLKDIGYSDDAVELLLNISNERRKADLARLDEKQARTEKQLRQAQKAILREQRSERTRIITDLNRSATKAAILSFYRSGLVTGPEAIVALEKRGISQSDAQNYLALEDEKNAAKKT